MLAFTLHGRRPSPEKTFFRSRRELARASQRGKLPYPVCRASSVELIWGFEARHVAQKK